MRIKTKKDTEDNLQVDLAVIANDIQYIKTDVGEIKEKMEKNYVTREEFDPIKKIVYGIVSVILLAVIGAVIKLVINN